jgi:HK97 family phage major capsid protein
MIIELKKDFLGKKAGERVGVPLADAEDLVGEGIARVVADDPLMPLITEHVSAALDKALADHQRKGVRSAPFPGAADQRGGFANFGEFAQCVKAACIPGSRPDDRLIGLGAGMGAKAISGMGEYQSSDGGFLVPPEFSERIFERIYATDTLLGMTDSYTVSSSGIAFPRNNETSRADGSRKGGIRGYWMDEGGQITSSKTTFGRLQLTLHKICVMCYVTDELLSDSAVALDQYLTNAAVEEVNFLIGDAIVNGPGAGRPLGILNASCTVQVAKETGQAAATVLTENIVKMWSRMFGPCRDKAVWLINQDVEPQLFTMTVGVGAGGQVTYLPPGGLSAKPFATLMGRPVLPVEWCATLGTAGDIILADLSQYVTISKGGIDYAQSMHLRFDYDEQAFRFVFRVDGQPWWSSALTPFKGSNTQSCFVTLATRS